MLLENKEAGVVGKLGVWSKNQPMVVVEHEKGSTCYYYDSLAELNKYWTDHQTRKKLVKNMAKCKLCGDVIESTSVHDYRHCECGEIFVDGGLDYQRCGANNLNNIEDLSIWEEE